MPKVSDIYRQKLEQAAMWMEKFEDRTQTTVVRDHFRDRAFALESDAESLAHCIARFGDFELDGADLGSKKAEIEGLTCCNRNPWAWGLEELEKAKQELATPGAVSLKGRN